VEKEGTVTDNSLLARARRAATDKEKLALYFELIAALAAHERAAARKGRETP
jgi:hypothetical protein